MNEPTPKPQVIDATIQCDRQRLRCARLRDLDTAGVFAVIAEPRLLKKDMPVHFCFTTREHGEKCVHLLRATVQTVTPEGARLEFGDLDLGTYSTLLHLAS